MLKLELTHLYNWMCWIKQYILSLLIFRHVIKLIYYWCFYWCVVTTENYLDSKYLFMFVIWSFLAPLCSAHEVWTYNDQKNQNHLITLQWCCILFLPASRLPHSITTKIWLIFRLKTWVCTKTSGLRWSVKDFGVQNNHGLPWWCKWLSSFEQH